MPVSREQRESRGEQQREGESDRGVVEVSGKGERTAAKVAGRRGEPRWYGTRLGK